MKYRVTIEGKEREVDVTFTPSGAPEVSLDGAKIEVDARRIGGAINLRIGDRVYDVLSAGTDEVQIAAGAARTIATLTSERAGQKRACFRSVKVTVPPARVKLTAQRVRVTINGLIHEVDIGRGDT